MSSGCLELQLCFHRRHTCCQHLKLVLLLLECLLHVFTSRHLFRRHARSHCSATIESVYHSVFVLSCHCVVRSARISVSRQDEICVRWQGRKNHTSKWLGCNGLSHATNMPSHLNTNRVWMGRRECAAQQQGDKKSILMSVPTRECLRKRNRDKTEPSFREHIVF